MESDIMNDMDKPLTNTIHELVQYNATDEHGTDLLWGAIYQLLDAAGTIIRKEANKLSQNFEPQQDNHIHNKVM